MWKRKELKNKAKKVVYRNYWTAIVVCFLIALFTGEFGTSIIGIWQSEDGINLPYSMHKKMEEQKEEVFPIDIFYNQRSTKETLNQTQQKVGKAIEANLNSAIKPQKYLFKVWDAINYFYRNQTNLGIILCVTAVIAFAFTILIADPLIVGGKRYFLKAREETNTKIGVIGEVFRKEHWLNIAIIMFLRNIYNALWYLTIIGGVIKTYEYRMIPYILAENPNIKRKEAFQISKQMMKKNKWKTFMLDISFLGWNFLSVLTLGLLSLLYVNPYNAATIAELYRTLKDEKENKMEKNVKTS